MVHDVSPSPASTPNPLYRPPMPHERQQADSNLRDAKWFVGGLFLVILLIAGFVVWQATSSHSAELDYELLEAELHRGTIVQLTISDTSATGDFLNTRQSFDGQVRGLDEPVPAGFTEQDARPVTSFTTEVPEGEVDDLVERAERHGVDVTVE